MISSNHFPLSSPNIYQAARGGPDAVGKTACLESRRSRVQTSLSPSSFKEGKSFSHRAVSSHSFHNPREVLLVQFSLHVPKGGLNPHSFHFEGLVVSLFERYQLYMG